jgi:hypothetical protein
MGENKTLRLGDKILIILGQGFFHGLIGKAFSKMDQITNYEGFTNTDVLNLECLKVIITF